MTDNSREINTPPATPPSDGGGVPARAKSGARVQKWGKGKTVAVALAISLAISVVAAAGVGVYAAYFYAGIYSGVRVQGVDLSGKTVAEARTLVEKAYDERHETRSFALTVGESVYNIEITRQDLGYDAEQTAELAHLYGRQGGFFSRLKDILDAISGGVDLAPAYSVNEQAIALKAEEIARDIGQESIKSSYEFDGKSLIIDRGQASLSVDEEQLKEFLRSKIGQGNFANAIFELEMREPDALDLALIKAQVEREMQNPRLDLENDPSGRTVLPAETGIYMDLQKAHDALAASNERFVKLPVEITQPQYTTREFEALLFRDVLAEGTTQFNAGLKGRTTNVLLANSFINGVILQPGEVFSYNDIVGPRTYERGFMDAIVYVGTSAEDGVGGGICQVSSTIYYAVLRADLEIVERRSHSRMVVYVPRGEDATVAWGSTDFKFKNNTDFPIKLVTSNTSNTITVQIIGTQLVENKVVKLDTTTLSHTPYETIYVIDPTLPVGTQKVDQTGYTGWRTETYRVIYIDGVEVSRVLENKSAYTKYDEVILHNPAPETTVPPATEPPATEPVVSTEPKTTEPPAVIGPPDTEPPEATDPPVSIDPPPTDPPTNF